MNLLFISPSRIGDAIISTGTLNHMLTRHPGINVTVAAPALTLPLFEAVPYLKQLILLEKLPHHRHWFRLWQQCWPTPWDIVIDIRGSPTAWFLKCRKRYIWRSPAVQRHRVEQLGDLIRVTPPPAPHIWLNEGHIRKARETVSAYPATLAISPAANWVGKQWPLSSFQALVSRFLARYEGQVAIFAAPEEKASILPLIDSIPENRRLDLVGKLSLPEIAACLQRCRAFVGNDSGLMHMAASTGIPVIGLFGPSNDLVYAPYSPAGALPNQVVRTPQSFEEIKKRADFSFQATHTFMNGLETGTVFRALETLLNREENQVI